MKNKYLSKIFLLFLFVASSGVSQTNYTVSVIPYEVYTTAATPITTSDDLYSGVIPIGFDFDYFGTVYNQLIISTNGYVGFNLGLASTLSPWNLNTQISQPNFTIRNSIFACYHDLNNSNQTGSITYSIVGFAPYRKFVVMFENQPHFQCSQLTSSFQLILYETYNFIDVQIVEKPICSTWNAGNALVGIINQDGTSTLTPPGRNTSSWYATLEGWRFARPIENEIYLYTVCDDNLDGFESFNLNLIKEAINYESPENVTIHETLSDAELGGNSLSGMDYLNINPYSQTLYAAFNGDVTAIALTVINCQNDYDLDTVSTDLEDVNEDGNLANDDTDGDGIPNYLDNDDDGDMVLSAFEYVFPAGRNLDQITNVDTDLDGIPNYLDNDDDGDGVLTIDEDYNGNNNPMDDDTNSNGIPDFLEENVALSLTDAIQLKKAIVIYPNPSENRININNGTAFSIDSFKLFTVNGSLVKELKNTDSYQNIDVSQLQSGVYFIAIDVNNQKLNYKFIKK